MQECLLSSPSILFKATLILNYVYLCGCLHMNTVAPRAQRLQISLELQVVVSCLMCVLVSFRQP